jgi:ribosomal protein S18 acetylase RimI-like enzyme
MEVKPMMRPAQLKDLLTIVRMHNQHIREAFLPKLGEKFLYYLYLGMLKAKSGVMLVYVEDELLKGYIFGTSDTKKLKYEILLSQGWGILKEVLKKLIVEPNILGQLWDLLQYEAKSKLDTRAELLYIAIDQEKRGGGLADALVREALQALAARGVTQVKVTTYALNRGANPLLQRLGFVPVKSFKLLHKEFKVYLGELKEILKAGPRY